MNIDCPKKIMRHSHRNSFRKSMKKKTYSFEEKKHMPKSSEITTESHVEHSSTRKTDGETSQTGWWYGGIPTPLKNMSSSVGMIFQFPMNLGK